MSCCMFTSRMDLRKSRSLLLLDTKCEKAHLRHPLRKVLEGEALLPLLWCFVQICVVSIAIVARHEPPQMLFAYPIRVIIQVQNLMTISWDQNEV